MNALGVRTASVCLVWVGVILALGLAGGALAAQGSIIVEVDAKDNGGEDYTVGVPVELGAGDWTLMVADNENDHFDAWSPWSSGDWVWRVDITLPDVWERDWWPDPTGYYGTQQEALEANLGGWTVISLDTPATVYFWMRDWLVSDNRGGVTVHVTPGAHVPDHAGTTLEVLPAALLADGESMAEIRLTLREYDGTPLPDKWIEFYCEDLEVEFTQPEVPTDENGEATGFVRSSQIGHATIKARIIDSGKGRTGSDAGRSPRQSGHANDEEVMIPEPKIEVKPATSGDSNRDSHKEKGDR